MPTVNEIIGALERRELAISNTKEHLENVSNLLKERYKTGNEYLISIGEKQVKEAKEDLAKYELELLEFKNRTSNLDLAKWMKQYLADNPHMTEQDVYDRLYGRFGSKKGDTKNESNRFSCNKNTM